jgi:hypothetical protein
MENLKLFFQAMRFGSQLADSAIWKNRQQSGNAIIGVLTVGAALLAHKGIVLTHEDIVSIAGAFSTIGFVWNGYLTLATSKSVGFGKTSADATEAVSQVQHGPIVSAKDGGEATNTEPIRSNESEPKQGRSGSDASRPESGWSSGTIMG